MADASGPVGYAKHWVQGVPAHVVTVDMNSPDVTVSPAIARHGVGSSEGFGSMLSRLQPTAAITGTYFCVKSLVPVGDLVVDGKQANVGSVGTGVCFTYDNKVEFRPTRPASSSGWTGYPSVICTGPRLVRNGIPSVSPWAEGFRDGAHYRRAQRSALGVTKHNKLLLVTVNRPVYLSRMARIMRDLGAVDAVSLDGGSSTALAYRGSVFSHPGRTLTNLIVVYESPARFAKIKPQLAPSPMMAGKSSRS
jgi:exopolysaccharide biosynthesis protein